MEKLKPTFHRSFSQNISLESNQKKKRQVSTLLVPPHLAKYVRSNGATSLLRKTLKSQRRILQTGNRINKESANTKYQRMRGKTKERKYIKFNARPTTSEWAQLRGLALSHGVSMCYLFAFMIEEYKNNKDGFDQKVIWQIKAAIHSNFKLNTFSRELWILEYKITKTSSPKIRNRNGPKIA
ncbi:DUF1564 family protein [Leptospira sarikeiensis]|uniref:DUF1564 family protein n=1 Tax=Leptospira sarikeiensis TaxID=2484943 RepID=A0A4R9K3N1_9LEPT|nr:DUF1564 family protein [Leptospira sarikeiensis]TGL58938.1 DUF1564 family protein [Leptospira sarikeiensis]